MKTRGVRVRIEFEIVLENGMDTRDKSTIVDSIRSLAAPLGVDLSDVDLEDMTKSNLLKMEAKLKAKSPAPAPAAPSAPATSGPTLQACDVCGGLFPDVAAHKRAFHPQPTAPAGQPPTPTTGQPQPAPSTGQKLPELPQEVYGKTLDVVANDLTGRGFSFVQPDDVRYEANPLRDGLVVRVGVYENNPFRAFVVVSGTQGQPPSEQKKRGLMDRLFGSESNS